ncbi:MAG: RNA-binding protein [uncultured Clostridium sp.]
MKDYKIFLSATDKKIADKSKLRIDLYGDMKIKDVSELKDFNILYFSKGHENLVTLNGEMIPRKVRYIQVFKIN